MPMSNDWFYDYFINELKAIKRNSITKPLTYDYMPEGYPAKNVQTVTLMEEQEVDFSIGNGELVGALSPVQFVPVLGQTYTISFDGAVYECEAKSPETGFIYFGNLHIVKPSSEDTGEPFIYTSEGEWLWLGLSGTIEMGNHTIGVTNVTETITPMAEEFMSQTPIFYFTFDDSVRCQTLYNEDETLVTIEQIRAVGINAILYDTSASAYYRPVSFNSHGDSAYYYIAKGNYAPEKVFYRAGFFKGLS